MLGPVCLKTVKLFSALKRKDLAEENMMAAFCPMVKTLDYTDKVDAVVVAHINQLAKRTVDYAGDDIYSGFARKLKLIDPNCPSGMYNTSVMIYQRS